MSKDENKAVTIKVTVSLSEPIVDLLDQIAATGYMGLNRADVAHRFIDQAVMKELTNPLLNLKRKTPNGNKPTE